MPNEQKLGIGTGIKLGIGGCIGVIIGFVGCAAIVLFIGWSYINSRSNTPAVQGIKETNRPAPKIPTVAQLVLEANTPDQIAKLTERNLKMRRIGYESANKVLVKGDIKLTLIGPDETIMFIECADCNKYWADSFLESYLNTPGLLQQKIEFGFTHIVMTDGRTTTIRELKSGQTRYYNEGFQFAS